LPEPFVERSRHQQQTFNSFEELAKNEVPSFLCQIGEDNKISIQMSRREGTISTMTARDLEQSSNKP
jgi:hypothetical protein